MLETTIHHMCPSSRGGANGSNKRPLEKDRHVHYHGLFENALPHEALSQVLLIHWESFTDEFRDKIADLLLEAEPEEIYKREMYKDVKKLREIPENIRGRFSELLQAIDEVPSE